MFGNSGFIHPVRKERGQIIRDGESGIALHIFEKDGEWEIWVNPEDSTFSGMCIASAPTSLETRIEAVTHLLKLVNLLIKAGDDGHAIDLPRIV